ncbi:uncharacterized protein L969DRAFT_53301 [Mixia osmundae IAM 14324]|uniref:Uncharacterized protein n=1 Tax=Mixia osmundae (strain CBS 9802 / IAM 14324 / JCM 22182 / KY 12970) TaxID=764103 RepID=G7DWH3_MIXOS|nr:uncharacterized protein L969DRAFT_53301 [Mixia osmundae IAM 14324]KEI37335.1 hypothetical protein L969DRAFT_53301 [Mixia osmundae IAM 14324]GAA94933.1 hypothetical protein E5Q_01588 [Mixia osmundae IAM 14324]
MQDRSLSLPWEDAHMTTADDTSRSIFDWSLRQEELTAEAVGAHSPGSVSADDEASDDTAALSVPSAARLEAVKALLAFLDTAPTQDGASSENLRTDEGNKLDLRKVRRLVHAANTSRDPHALPVRVESPLSRQDSSEKETPSSSITAVEEPLLTHLDTRQQRIHLPEDYTPISPPSSPEVGGTPTRAPRLSTPPETVRQIRSAHSSAQRSRANVVVSPTPTRSSRARAPSAQRILASDLSGSESDARLQVDELRRALSEATGPIDRLRSDVANLKSSISAVMISRDPPPEPQDATLSTITAALHLGRKLDAVLHGNPSHTRSDREIFDKANVDELLRKVSDN